MMDSDSMMANGMSRFGFFASSPVQGKYYLVDVIAGMNCLEHKICHQLYYFVLFDAHL